MKIILETGDSEAQMMMAKAMLANGLVRAVEQSGCSSARRVQKSDDEVAAAVVRVVATFGVCTQWTAVYRVLVDFCGWESDIAKFAQRMNHLLKGVHLSFPCDYQAIQKPLSKYSILRKDFSAWAKYQAADNDRVFSRQLFIARELLNILSISP